jgi:hypothetical protein
MLTFLIVAGLALMVLVFAGLAIAGTLLAMVCWLVLLPFRILFRVTAGVLGGFFGVVLLPILVVIVGVIVVGALVAAVIGAIVPGILPLAAVALIGWAIYKGATRRGLRSSDSGLRF